MKDKLMNIITDYLDIARKDQELSLDSLSDVMYSEIIWLLNPPVSSTHTSNTQEVIRKMPDEN